MRLAKACAGLAVMLLFTVGHAFGQEVGTKAPPLKPEKWWNNKGPVSWSALAGRVLLIEKWATW